MRRNFSMGQVITRLVPVLLISLFLLPLTAHAEIKAGSIEITPFGGYNFFEKRQNLLDRPVVGARLGYNITNTFGIEGSWQFIDTGVDNKTLRFSQEGQFTSPIDSVRINMYHLDLLYHFLPEGNFNPFLAVGYGAVHYSPKINNKNMSILDFGAGAKYWLTEHFALRADVRDNMVFDESIHNVEATLGLVFAFGGKSKAEAAPVAKSEPCPEPAATQPPPIAQEKIIVPAAEPAPKLFKYCITLNLDFDIDKADIKPQFHDDIARVGDFMKKYPTTTATIEGHTDNVGTAEYNMDLSQRRAESVVTYLTDKFGIDRSRLAAKGYGLTRPKADNSTNAGKQVNRRIEAIIDCSFDVREIKPPDRLCLSLQVEFDSGKADLKSQYTDEIAKLGEYMKKYPTTTATIEGHTDDVGGYESNMRLSQKRAESVVAYLVKNFGINSSRLFAKGYGPTRRIAYNSTPEGRQQNRRINAIVDCVIR